MKVTRLTERHAPAMEELLLTDPLVNLFLLGYMDVVPVHRAYWYGTVDGDRVLGLALIVPGRLMVPFAPEPGHGHAIGEVLHRRHRPCMVVGPREASDEVWARWAEGVAVDRCHDQRLYVCREPPPGPRMPGFRRALLSEAEQLVAFSAAMEWEDIGRRALEEDAVGYRAVVHRRIEHGQTWVLEEEGELRFQINVGTTTPWGVQVGGTYVPPAHRGQGLATRCMAELGRRLLPRHRAITLHVNEANTHAVRAYERSGYARASAYRLITLPPGP